MKATYLIAIISLLLLAVACVPTAEELANITDEKEEVKEPEVEVKQEITIVPMADNKTETKDVVIEEKKENTTNTRRNMLWRNT